MTNVDDVPAVNPITEPWWTRIEHARWVYDLQAPLRDARAINAWWTARMTELVDAFAGFARIREALVADDEGPARLMREPGETQRALVERFLAVVATRKTPISGLELALDLRVWFRTADSGAPVLAWWSSGSNYVESYADPDDGHAWITLNINPAPFTAYSPEKDDNLELHRLNEPLLEEALRRWRDRSGATVHHEELLRGRTELGFSSDYADYWLE